MACHFPIFVQPCFQHVETCCSMLLTNMETGNWANWMVVQLDMIGKFDVFFISKKISTNRSYLGLHELHSSPYFLNVIFNKEVRDLAIFNLLLCFVHFICKFYLLALSQEAVSVGQPAVAAAVHPVFVCGVSWGMMLLRCFFSNLSIFSHFFLQGLRCFEMLWDGLRWFEILWYNVDMYGKANLLHLWCYLVMSSESKMGFPWNTVNNVV